MRVGNSMKIGFGIRKGNSGKVTGTGRDAHAIESADETHRKIKYINPAIQ